jgi:CTP:molybdopterin cytidylyltransferase MocA
VDLPSPFGADVKVLVMSGSDPPPARRRADRRGVPLTGKAFLTLHGRLVIEYVLDLLRECGFTRVWVLAEEDKLALIPRHYRYTPITQSPHANFAASLATAERVLEPGADEPILVVFGDHPLQTPNALRVFLARAAEALEQADLFHALASTAAYREYATWFERTSVHMREMSGRASGYTLVIPSRLHGLSVLGELYEVRKLERFDSLLRLMFKFPGLLGRDAPRALVDAALVVLAKEMEKVGRGSSVVATPARFLESWFSARVPAGRLERCAARVLGAERGIRLIPVAHGGIAIDVDFAEELATLEAHWEAVQQLSARQDAELVHP